MACVWLGWFGREFELRRRERFADTLQPIILQEISSLGNHEWAGEYYCGDGMGFNLSLTMAPKSGYLFEARGCTGRYGRNYGPVTPSADRLRLAFRRPVQRERLFTIADQLIQVHWGPRRYLISPKDMLEFCNAINAGTEPRTDIHGLHLLRCGDEAKAVQGLPTVPDEFKDYLLARPIEAEIIEVMERAENSTLGVLNRGKMHGLLPGMELHIIEPDHALESVCVTAVRIDDGRCEASITSFFDDAPAPQPRWKLSTRRAW
ncbi:MAG: hypothetical protein ACREJM_05000 [Candidatus Saccharimonadales bacterium]